MSSTLAIHQPNRFVTRPVYVACEVQTDARGREPKLFVRDRFTRDRFEVRDLKTITVAGEKFVLGTVVDAEGPQILVEFEGERMAWVDDCDTIRPAAVQKRPQARKAS